MELIIALPVIGLVVAAVIITRLIKRNKRLNEKLSWFQGTYLHKGGATTMMPDVSSYHLFSSNGGRDWCALGERQEILGPVEKIYPGLLAHLDGMDALLDHVKTHGAIGSQGQVTSDEIGLLKKAGFTVQS